MRHEEILGLLPSLKWMMDNSPGLTLFLYELIFWALVIALTFILLRWKPAILERAESRVRGFAQHTRIWLPVFIFSVIAIRTAMLPWVPVPIPEVHDEFSYLLGSDTFAHGRLTNPPHPMWQHFESFHINVQPTYQSMYPPAQGLTLAVGQKLIGVPWAGVVLSTALLCGAIYWMLLGWLPTSWAWLGGVFAVLRYSIFSYWNNSYWGGSVAALGGALLLGCYPRLREEFRTRILLLSAVALLILANSRPLEGFMFSLPFLGGIGILLLRKAKTEFRMVAAKFAPAVALLLLGAVGLLYYNWRGTGHPLLMPYMVNLKTYHISNPFIFQRPNPIPQYRDATMRSFYVIHEYPDVLRMRMGQRGEELIYLFRLKDAVFYAFYLWPWFLLVVPTAYVMLKDKRLRIIPLALLSMALVLYAQIWNPTPHYAAPAAGAVILIVLYGLRRIASSLTAGPWFCRATVIVFGLWLLSPITERLRDPYAQHPFQISQGKISDAVDVSGARIPLQLQRARIESQLSRTPGKHLVIVHPKYHDIPGIDFVFNKAIIDDAKIVWARDEGYLDNRELVNYYPDRQVWYADRGNQLVPLLPYDQAILPWKLALSKYETSEEQDAYQNLAGAHAVEPRLGSAQR
jgi:hypothetical protein